MGKVIYIGPDTPANPPKRSGSSSSAGSEKYSKKGGRNKRRSAPDMAAWQGSVGISTSFEERRSWSRNEGTSPHLHHKERPQSLAVSGAYQARVTPGGVKMASSCPSLLDEVTVRTGPPSTTFNRIHTPPLPLLSIFSYRCKKWIKYLWFLGERCVDPESQMTSYQMKARVGIPDPHLGITAFPAPETHIFLFQL